MLVAIAARFRRELFSYNFDVRPSLLALGDESLPKYVTRRQGARCFLLILRFRLRASFFRVFPVSQSGQLECLANFRRREVVLRFTDRHEKNHLLLQKVALLIEKNAANNILFFLVHFAWQVLIGIVDFVRFEIFGGAVMLQNLQKAQNLPGVNL